MSRRHFCVTGLTMCALLVLFSGQACPPDTGGMIPEPNPTPGADGLNCWDLDGDGQGDANEDVNGDGVFDALDCQGPPGVSPFALNGNDAVYTDGNIGIGTNSPSSALHVVGTISADAFSSNSPLQLQTAGTTRIFVDDTTGNVGIGTTSPGDTLHLAAPGIARMLIQTLDDSSTNLRFLKANGFGVAEMWFDVGDNEFNIKAIPLDSTLNLLGGNNQGVVVNDSGQVLVSESLGIRDADDPQNALVISDNVSSTSTPLLRIGHQGNFNEAYSGIIVFDEDVGFSASNAPDNFCGFAIHHDGGVNRLNIVSGCTNATDVDTSSTLVMSMGTTGIVGIADEPAPGIALNVGGDCHVSGELTATTKNFVHPHPGDP